MIEDPDQQYAPACRCNKCGRIEAYHRLGCRCTPSFSDEQDMEYGYFDMSFQYGSWEDVVTAIAMKIYATEAI